MAGLEYAKHSMYTFSCRDTVGNTPLHYAMELEDWDSQQSIIQLLKGKGAKADAINMNGERPESFTSDDLLGACTHESVDTDVAAIVNKQPVSGEEETPLHLLTKSDHMNVLVFKQLVYAGAKYAQWLMCFVVCVLQHFTLNQASDIAQCSLALACCKAACLQVTQ